MTDLSRITSELLHAIAQDEKARAEWSAFENNPMREEWVRSYYARHPLRRLWRFISHRARNLGRDSRETP